MPARTTRPNRVRAAQIANRVRWANCEDRSAATAPARQGLRDRFLRQVDPDGVLAPAERERLAAEAQSRHFSELAKRSHAARWGNTDQKPAAA